MCFLRCRFERKTVLRIKTEYLSKETCLDDDVVCHECGKRFAKKYNLITHRLAFHTEAPEKFTCEICHKEFRFKSNYRAHKNIHLDLPRSYSCKNCDCKFKNARALKGHLLTHETEKNFVCESCGKKFHTSANLRNHIRTHSDQRPHMCEMCSCTFKRRSHVFQHQKDVHGITVVSSNMTFSCDTCSAMFTTKERLDMHLRKHTGLMPYHCELCGRKFTSSVGVKVHQSLGTCDTRTVKCEVCQKTFAYNQEPCEHVSAEFKELTSRNEKKQPPAPKPDGPKLPRKLRPKTIKCDVCSRVFLYQCEMRLHYRTHTDERPYVCDVCGKAFKARNTLANHKATHLDLRPFNCYVCGKSFKRPEHLTLHNRTHTGEKPYLCSVCGRGFAQLGDCKKHCKIHERKTSESETKSEQSSTDESDKEMDDDDAMVSQCQACKTFCEDDVELQEHIRNSHPEEMMECKLCGDVVLKVYFSDHVKRSHGFDLKHGKGNKVGGVESLCSVELDEPDTQPPIDIEFKGEKCPFCKQSYSNKLNLKKHLYNVHRMQRVRCNVCDKEVNKKSLDRHMRSVHSARVNAKKERKSVPDDEKVPCHLCPKKCANMGSLHAHVKNIHEAEQFDCSQCDFRASKRSLERHMKKEHNSVVYQCTRCSKVLKSKSTLKEHMWIHTEDRRFICDVCGMRFKRTSNYHGHLKSHQEKKFQCQLCGNFFLRKRYLAVHQQTIHDFYGKGVPPQEKGYQCEVCGVKLKWKNNLMAHMRIHTGEKPYKCKVCGDDFTCHGSLRTHISKHAISTMPCTESTVLIQAGYLSSSSAFSPP